jgi:hypothetical protein
VEEILTGKGDYYLGLIPLCNMYLDYIGCVFSFVRACFCLCVSACVCWGGRRVGVEGRGGGWLDRIW